MYMQLYMHISVEYRLLLLGKVGNSNQYGVDCVDPN